jgi:D-xylose transport system ATP-binding protein
MSAPNAKPVVLRTRKLTKRFPGVLALRDVDLELRQGEVHALCGENGAGKSTLIKCLSGVWPHGSYEGGIEVGGQEVCFRQVADSERAGIGVIYQELALVREMTVAENVFLGKEPKRAGVLVDWDRLYGQAAEVLAQYGLDLDPAARVGDLGVGQQQMVEIVKALVKDSRILLLDEPTAALTESEVDILLRIVGGLRERGITCVYISHKLDEVLRIADRVTVLRDGLTVTTLATEETDQNEIIRHMVGREITDLFPRRASAPGEALLAVRDLSVRDAEEGRDLVRDVSFAVHAGEVVGIGGLMGAGRTELLMHLFAGVGQRLGGEVTVAGQSYTGTTPVAAIRAGMMLVSEDRKRYGLVLEQSVGFNLSLASLGQFLRGGVFLDAPQEVRSNQEAMRSLAIKAPSLEYATGQLSGGNQQKVVLGKALMTAPSVVFLDEPTRGIDVGAKQEVYGLVNRLTEEGKGVVLVSSELPELMGMSDRMIILSEGRIGGEFARGEASQEDILRAAMRFS